MAWSLLTWLLVVPSYCVRAKSDWTVSQADSGSHELGRAKWTQRALRRGGGVAETHTFVSGSSWFRLHSSASQVSPEVGCSALLSLSPPLLLLSGTIAGLSFAFPGVA